MLGGHGCWGGCQRVYRTTCNGGGGKEDLSPSALRMTVRVCVCVCVCEREREREIERERARAGETDSEKEKERKGKDMEGERKRGEGKGRRCKEERSRGGETGTCPPGLGFPQAQGGGSLTRLHLYTPSALTTAPGPVSMTPMTQPFPWKPDTKPHSAGCSRELPQPLRPGPCT
uniref:Uncharacterized protein n=1 Tax=Pipistrellus kuhlii TaxID=59472 RepID=A0A7J8A7L7_PIPKU|nr:hypothetical protein mPipKuh1_008806 [Pipistrellus kuhlii]